MPKVVADGARSRLAGELSTSCVGESLKSQYRYITAEISIEIGAG